MSTIVPISFWTTKSDLIRLAGNPNGLRDKYYIGLPFKLHDDENFLSRSFVVLRVSRFFNPHLKREASRLGGLVTRTVLSNRDRNAGWLSLLQIPEIRKLRQNSDLSEAWTYMLIDIVLRERPQEYLAGKQHIADFFAERFQLEFGFDLDPPFIREEFHHQLLERAYLDASLDLKMELAFRQQEIITAMENLQLASETFMQMMMVLMGMLCGLTEVLILDIILEAFIGYITFLHDLEKAEADGLITEDEAFGSWFALAGIFLPFLPALKSALSKYGGKAGEIVNTLIDTGFGIIAIAALLLQIASMLIQGAAALLEAIAADEAGFDDFGQYDPANTLYIPA